MVIVENKIKCKICGDIIESNSVHDFNTCSCGACSVDGGHWYLRRCWDPNKGGKDDVIEELCVIEEDATDEKSNHIRDV